MNLTDRRESIEAILFEVRTMVLFRQMWREHKDSRLGFMFKDLYLTAKWHVERMVRAHRREHYEQLDIKVFERMMS